MMPAVRTTERGQTLIEVVVGVAILVTVLVAATSVATKSLASGVDAYHRLRANSLAVEALEAMRNYRDEWLREYQGQPNLHTRWNNDAMPASSASGRAQICGQDGSGTCGGLIPGQGRGAWYFDRRSSSEQITGSGGSYLRRIWVLDAPKLNPNDATEVAGDRKEVTVRVSWTAQDGSTQGVSLTTILSIQQAAGA